MNRVVELLKKSDIYKPKESTKSSSTWCTGSDAHELKESQHPPTQEQSDEVITTPKAGSDCGASDSTSASAISLARANINNQTTCLRPMQLAIHRSLAFPLSPSQSLARCDTSETRT
ncbi:hypothetical protein BASA62_007400 [Batrachochytrium salamandrivorans]|nr:hypothetical protein BASA62_007400 [Batrachochytrium salamandrivorans]